MVGLRLRVWCTVGVFVCAAFTGLSPLPTPKRVARFGGCIWPGCSQRGAECIPGMVVQLRMAAARPRAGEG